MDAYQEYIEALVELRDKLKAVNESSMQVLDMTKLIVEAANLTSSKE